ncbi:MAG: ABC transporter permease [Acidobacteriia bacterium]|nr:ABC transporter permease [Terriglobia bacterium]
MTSDVRFALRMILSHRWFSAAVVATLALGIGLNTMVFTLVYAVLFKPVPVPGGERLVAISNRNVKQGSRGMNVSYPDFLEYRAGAASMEALEASSGAGATLSERGNPPQRYTMSLVTSGLFEMMGTRPVVGRGIQPGDVKAGAEAVVLLGYGVWRDRYGSSREMVGRVVRVNSKPATVIGVMPEGFKFPSNHDLWMPLVPTAELEDRTRRQIQVFGMLKPGKTISQAGAELEVIARRLAAQFPKENKDVEARVETFHERFNGGPIRMVFTLMLAAVGFVLLIVCANIANMMLGRAMVRRQEISIRMAMGASRWRVMRQLLIESMVLSTLGGTLGLALSALGVHAFTLASSDVGKPYWVQFTMDYTVFGYLAAVCVLSSLLFGLAPAFRASRVDLNSALKDGTRSAGTHRGGRISAVLVVFQFALTVVLLTGAGVFMRGFMAWQSFNPMVPAGQILTARINLPQAKYGSEEARLRFYEQLLPRLGSLPGVNRVALGSDPPGLGARGRRIEIEDAPLEDPARGPSASVVSFSPGYLETIRLPVLAGRDFNETDGMPGRLSAIVTKEFADRHWPKKTAAGKRFRFYQDNKPGEWITVIGVSANIVQRPFEATPDPLLFLPHRQTAYDSMVVLIRSEGNLAGIASAARAAVQQLDQDLPLFDVRTLVEAIARQTWFIAVFGTVFFVFALFALLIASVGVYAVIAQATTRRTQEIGVRMALGATSGNILHLILGRGLRQVAIGLAIGLAAAFPAARLMTTSILVQVSPSDPMVFTGVSLLLAMVGLLACWLPARRAAELNPVKAIRYE